MAKLPGAENLSSPPSVAPNGFVAKADWTHIADAMAQRAQGIKALAAGIASAGDAFSGMAENQQAEADRATEFTAESEKIALKSKWANEFVDRSKNAAVGAPDFTSNFLKDMDLEFRAFVDKQPTDALKQKYGLELLNIREGYLAKGRDFEDEEATRLAGKIVSDGQNQILDTLSKDPNAWKQADADNQKLIESQPDANPRLNDERMRAWKIRRGLAQHEMRKTRDGSAAASQGLGVGPVSSEPISAGGKGVPGLVLNWAKSKGLPPYQIAALMQTIRQESGFRPGIRGDAGQSIGLFQMNPAGGRQARFLRRTGPNWANNPQAQLDAWWDEIHNEESATGRAFLGSTSVEGATEALLNNIRPKNWNEAGKAGWEWRNRTSGARQIMAQISNGQVPSASGGGGVGGSGAVGPVAPEYADLPFETRQKLYEEDMKEHGQQSRLYVEQTTPDVLTSIERSGGYEGQEPTLQNYVDAYKEEGAQRYEAFQQARETAQTVHGFRTESEADIRSTLDQAEKAIPDGPGADAAQKQFEMMTKAAAQTLEARNKAPAEYALQVNPKAAAAWKNYDPKNPKTAQTAIAMTVDTQKQLGINPYKIEPMMPEAAKAAVQVFKDPNKKITERADAVTSTVLMTPDPLQQAQIFDQLVKAGLPASTEAAIEAAGRGDQEAARNLFTAALTDVSQFPQIKDTTTKDNIYREVDRQLRAPGSMGEAYYGLQYADPANYERLGRDIELIRAASAINMANGASYQDAVDRATRDLFGDVDRMDGHLPSGAALDAVLPINTPKEPLLRGLEAQMPRVKAAVGQAILASREAYAAAMPAATSGAAINDAVHSQHFQDVINNGVFRQIGLRGNELGFLDTTANPPSFVTTPDGKTLTFKVSDVVAAGIKPRVFSAAMGGTPGAVVSGKPELISANSKAGAGRGDVVQTVKPGRLSTLKAEPQAAEVEAPAEPIDLTKEAYDREVGEGVDLTNEAYERASAPTPGQLDTLISPAARPEVEPSSSGQKTPRKRRGPRPGRLDTLIGPGT